MFQAQLFHFIQTKEPAGHVIAMEKTFIAQVISGNTEFFTPISSHVNVKFAASAFPFIGI